MVNSIAIMQPYFLPYIGYWQLMASVEKFIVYDDVNYIKGGWVNRNRIVINGRPSYFTIPLVGASPNKKISELKICNKMPWREKINMGFKNTYSRSAHFAEVMPVLASIIDCKEENLSNFLFEQLIVMRDALGVEAKMERASTSNVGAGLSGVQRVLSICHSKGAKTYVNLPGGRDLYSDYEFRRDGIELRFLQSQVREYKQRHSDIFFPSLSIVDVLFNCGLDMTRQALRDCTLAQ